jgi:hypothetical protein
MAASGARRERAVHPLVGGIFSSEPQHGIFEESATLSVPAEPQRFVPPPLNRLGESATAERAEMRSEPPPVEARSALEQRETEPLLPRTRLGAETSSAKDDLVSRAQAGHIELDQGIGETGNEPPLSQVHQTILPLELRTLLVPQERRADPTERLETASSAMRLARPQVDPPAATHRAGRQEGGRRTEDIQIHIGRIEVIAVSQPVQRAAPAAARKTESLGEYLRRQDGRPR